MRTETIDLDVLVIGSGFSGIYALHALRQAGKRALIVDAAGGVGGTWYWNRYPGLVVDIESIEYSFAFSDELQQEWSWSSRYAPQPEIERYLNFVVDYFDLRKQIHLDTHISSMTFDEDKNVWVAKADDGRVYVAKYAVMGTGLLSAPKYVSFEGQEDFEGEIYHTFNWPDQEVSFEGKRVGVIGTGASGIQVIPFAAKEAEQLYVYQRTPTWAVPLRNGPMDRAFEAEVKQNYAEWRNKERFGSFGGWSAVNQKPIDQVLDLAMEQTEEVRTAMYEDRWENGGLAFYNVFPDVFFDQAANDTLVEFFREKLKERIKDPELQRLLIPEYPILMRRLAGETDYYEAYSQENVSLVDLNEKPIKHFTHNGLVVGEEEHVLDMVVFATGFDAMSGALLRMEIVGRDGKLLSEHWRKEIQTAYGMMASGFPNMFYLSGPGSPAPLFQPVLFCQDQMEWIIHAMDHLETTGGKAFEPKKQLEKFWLEECDEKFHASLFGSTESWYNGKNIDGKAGRGLIYFGGIHPYREFIQNAENNEYEDFLIQ